MGVVVVVYSKVWRSWRGAVTVLEVSGRPRREGREENSREDREINT